MDGMINKDDLIEKLLGRYTDEEIVELIDSCDAIFPEEDEELAYEEEAFRRKRDAWNKKWQDRADMTEPLGTLLSQNTLTNTKRKCKCPKGKGGLSVGCYTKGNYEECTRCGKTWATGVKELREYIDISAKSGAPFDMSRAEEITKGHELVGEQQEYAASYEFRKEHLPFTCVDEDYKEYEKWEKI